MDEYDVFIREGVSKELIERYFRFLNGLFKNATLRPAISLAYLTGILPIVRDKVQSKLNNFREYTILDAMELSEYVGFSSQEVEALCRRYDMNLGVCRHWYNGYAQHGYEIYNPESVVMSMTAKRFETWWNKTSTYMVIAESIRMKFEGLKDEVIRLIAGENIEVNVDTVMNTMDSFASKDDVFTYLTHLGYLAYDCEKKTCRIPNWEVRQEWINAIAYRPSFTY